MVLDRIEYLLGILRKAGAVQIKSQWKKRMSKIKNVKKKKRI